MMSTASSKAASTFAAVAWPICNGCRGVSRRHLRKRCARAVLLWKILVVQAATQAGTRYSHAHCPGERLRIMLLGAYRILPHSLRGYLLLLIVVTVLPAVLLSVYVAYQAYT